MATDYYKILGVSKNATDAEIKTAYRKLVKEYHPDLHPNDEKCAAKFKEINEAHETLSDPEKRKQYDFQQEHPEFAGAGGGFGGQGFGGFGGFGDIFGDIFSQFTGGGARAQRDITGEDVTIELELSFMDAAKGCRKDITYTRREPCSSCGGTGAKNGTSYTTCDKCHGSGQIQYRTGGGIFQTVRVATCDVCNGTGKKITERCPDCSGKGYNKKATTITLDIPAGADTGSYMKKRGYGHASNYGGESGDAIIVFKVAPHKILKRKNFDIYVDLPISYKTAVLGGRVSVAGIDNAVDFDIPEGTQSGKVFVIRGKGIQSSRGRGDLYVTVNVEIPTRLSRSQKQDLENFDEQIELKQYSKIKEYSTNVESMYGVNPYKD